MKSLRPLIDRKLSALVATFGLILGVALPAAFPISVYAGSITSRSIAVTNSAAAASGVTYHLTATVQTGLSAGGGLIVEFCSDSPLVGLTCTHPGGFSANGITTTGSTTAGTATDLDATDHSTIKWAATGAVSGGSTVDITFNNIHNPTAVGTYYARVTSYINGTNLGGYTNATTGIGTYADSGGIALSTTNDIGVTAYVRESLTFCVGGGTTTTPTASCGNVGAGLPSPSMTIGEDIGNGAKALDPGFLSTGADTAQLSTNAAGGAVVNLHSSTVACGGLVRPGTANCDIAPQGTSGASFAAGTAKFGLVLGATSDVGTASGALTPVNGYDATHYYIDWDSGDTTGVTSPYGSPLFNSGGNPVSNKNIPITFAASASNTTPAGIYTATLNLIATGTF